MRRANLLTRTDGVRWTLRVLASLLLSSGWAVAQVGVITTVAGGGPNNLPATSVNLSTPSGVAVDSAGNYYVSTRDQRRVFKVDTSGQLTVVAGNGLAGFSGDGGPATDASLRNPFGLAVDSSGNVYIADVDNHRVRRVDPAAGIITTVAGTGIAGFAGDGGAATSARLNSPEDVALDAAGNLYIADFRNQRIRRVDAATGVITTVAGSGIAGFFGDGGLATNAQFGNPRSISLDAVGNLYVADQGNRRIRRVDATTGIITTVAGTGSSGPCSSGEGGPATSASFGPAGPTALEVDSAGNIWVVDQGNNCIRRVDHIGVIRRAAGTGVGGYSGDGGPATDARLRVPTGVAVDTGGHLFIADRFNLRIRRVNADTAVITTAAGNGSIGFGGEQVPALDAGLLDARAIAVDTSGNLFITDGGNDRIRRVDAVTGTISTVAGNGLDGNTGDGGPATDATLFNPTAAVVDTSGNLFIASREVIRRVDAATGVITTYAGCVSACSGSDGGPATAATLNSVAGLALDTMGNLFIADLPDRRVRRVDAATGIITTVAGDGLGDFSGDGGPAIHAGLGAPVALAIDGAGNLFVVDRGSRRIRRVDAVTGVITTVAGGGSGFYDGDGGLATNASLAAPAGVTVDSHSNVFIADDLNHTIRRVDAITGIIETVAGHGSFGFAPDGTMATSASLAGPVGMALVRGGLLFADVSSNRIRRIELPTNTPPVADAGSAQTLIVGEIGIFDGSTSSDSDGTIESYIWSFGDGGTSGGTVAQHAYSLAGSFTATLTVTDDQGATGSDTALITVITSSQAIDLLAGAVASYNLRQGISNSLDKKLELARAALDAANAGLREGAANTLQSFINEVEAQRDKELTGAQANELVAFAKRIVSVM